MLHLISAPFHEKPGTSSSSLNSHTQVSSFFSFFQPETMTWLVSDLRWKLDLQNLFLQRYGGYTHETFLRATELWRSLLSRWDRQWTLCSSDQLKVLLQTLQRQDPSWQSLSEQQPQWIQDVLPLLDQYCGVFAHPQGLSMLLDWFHQEQKTDEHLSFRLRLGKLIYDYFCQQKITSPHWVASLLLQNADVQQLWKRDLCVDLGCFLTMTEAELLWQISQTQQVYILEPSAQLQHKYSYMMKPYHFLSEKLQSTSASSSKSFSKQESLEQKESGKNHVYSFSGPLAEVKHVIHTIRNWIENQNVDPQKIAVMAADIESYWPMLQYFGHHEGLVWNKKNVYHQHSENRWQHLMAHLKMMTDQVKKADLHGNFFGQIAQPSVMSWDQFQSYFADFGTSEDLEKAKTTFDTLTFPAKLTSEFSSFEFVTELIRFLSFQVDSSFHRSLQSFLEKTPRKWKHNWSEWLQLLSIHLARREEELDSQNQQGVHCLPFRSAESLAVTHRIFLGLSEENFKKNSSLFLKSQDCFLIYQHLGFHIENPEDSKDEYCLHRLALETVEESHSCFAATDGEGSLQTAHPLWIQQSIQYASKNHERVFHSPGMTVVDSQGQYVSQDVKMRWQSDFHLDPQQTLKLPELPSLSISRIEQFLQCPFIFAAQKYFGMKDLADKGIDLDPRDKGSLTHGMLEFLMKNNLSSSQEEVLQFLEQQRQKHKISWNDDHFWSFHQAKLLKLAEKFCQFEKSFRNHFPQQKVVALEQRLSFQWQGFSWTGSIDRIDGTSDDQRRWIYDYKSSGTGLTSWKSWLKNHQWQLLFYTWVLEHPLISQAEKVEVVGALYYILKDFQQKKGFVCASNSQGFSNVYAKASVLSQDEKKEVLEKFEQDLIHVLEKIQQGHYLPLPADIKECSTCHWRALCRAPHLI